jgi:hypothetical protein
MRRTSSRVGPGAYNTATPSKKTGPKIFRDSIITPSRDFEYVYVGQSIVKQERTGSVHSQSRSPSPENYNNTHTFGITQNTEEYMEFNDRNPFPERPQSSQIKKNRKYHRRNLSLDMDTPNSQLPNLSVIPEKPNNQNKLYQEKPFSPAHREVTRTINKDSIKPFSPNNKTQIRNLLDKTKNKRLSTEEINTRSQSPKKERLIMLVGHKNKNGHLGLKKQIINKVNLSYNYNH